MAKITDMLISAILKKGILYEARNCDMDFIIPTLEEQANGEEKETKIIVKFKAEHMTLKIEKSQGQ